MVNPPNAALEVANLSVTYARGGRRLTALDRVNIQVRQGEFVCVVGASGCGKTTLLRAIDGLVKPSGGDMRINGQRARKADERIAMVFQQDSLFPWRTALENVRFGLDVRRRKRQESTVKAQSCLDLVGLSGFGGYYPYELSGGMQQRINLARALAVDPDVLLMDEPFASLDAQTREVMQGELLRLWRMTKKTVLFITHQLDEAVLLGDRVVVMSAHPGRVREDIEIDIPRPRDLTSKRSAAFVGYVDRIWGLIEAEVRGSMDARPS